MKCLKCGYESERVFSSCPSCGGIASEYIAVDKELGGLQNKSSSHGKWHLFIVGAIGLSAIFVLLWFLFQNNKKPDDLMKPKSEPDVKSTNIGSVVSSSNHLTKRKSKQSGLDAQKAVSSTNQSEPPKTQQKVYKDKVKETFLKGIQFGLEGDMDRAREQFLTIMETHPDYKPAVAALELLDSVIDHEEAQSALSLYFQGAMLQTENYSIADTLTVYKEAARIYKDMGMRKYAITILDTALSVAPKDVQLLSSLGQLWASERAWEKAEEFFKAALQKDQANREATSRLALVYGIEGRWDMAIRMLQKDIPLRAQDGEMDFYLALACYYTKQFALSRQFVDKAMQLGYKVNPTLLAALKSNQQLQ